ncbi:MAG TPA: class I lanthipeptide [Thermoanaerobaculia bacterium]|jgi:hypothetical protein
MKKQTVKKLQIRKETLLPLDSRQMREVLGGIAAGVAPPKDTDFLHVDGDYSTLYGHWNAAVTA